MTYFIKIKHEIQKNICVAEIEGTFSAETQVKDLHVVQEAIPYILIMEH